MAGPRRWAIAGVALVALLAACSDDGGETATPSSTTTTTTTTSTTTTTTVPSGGRGVATWPLVDAVPAFRKAGVLVVAGVDHRPILGASLEQVAVELSLTADAAVFALAPERGEVAFDQIQLGAVDGPAAAWPFVITASGDLTVFVPAEDERDCADAVAEPDALLAEHGVVPVDDAFVVTGARCGLLRTDDSGAFGQLPQPADGVNSFGVLLRAVGARLPDSTVRIDWLALAASTETAPAADLRIRVVGREHALAARSADPDDDAALDALHVLRDDGSTTVVDIDPAGGFTVPRANLGVRAKLWVDDYGLEHFVQQGPWIDVERITTDLTIDMTPEFPVADGPPPDSYQTRRPHDLQIWNGSTALERQQFQGLNWNNNLGQADRDRDRDNAGECSRAAWFGGSYVQALQTRVDQKPGLIAEALLELGSDRCHEVFSVARSLYSVETHAANARQMVEEFGVTHLIFAVSGNELCRMDDASYTDIHGVAADTPVHWRLIDGELVEPFTRSAATAVEPDPDFDRRDACSFRDAGDPGAAEVIDKLRQLGDLYEDLGPEVEVTFFVMKDVLAGADVTAGNVYDMCLTTGHRCVLLDEPVAREKPADLVEEDYIPFLLRYVGDGHPNARANQHIGRGLAALITAAELDAD
ncbi:MAG: hypothetical protein R8F63_19230 [Acidimicrobiales bacterium]|nr:hypothetical protein [Acidimicrobiales bacterium]